MQMIISIAAGFALPVAVPNFRLQLKTESVKEV